MKTFKQFVTESEPKLGQYDVHLRGGPKQRTQWSYFVTNPQGGGFGTNSGAGVSMTRTHQAAVRHMPDGTVYTLRVNDEPRGEMTRGQEPWKKS